MRIDLHCHSKYSLDTTFEPELLIEQALRMNLDGVCFTEHDSLEASEPVAAISVPEGFSVFRGLEIATAQGHLLVYGLKDDSWNSGSLNSYPDAREVIEKVHLMGGVCAPAHPFRPCDSFGDALMRINSFDAIETHNGRDAPAMNRKALETSRMAGLPSIGGSDCHNQKQVGRACTLFQNPVHTLQDLVDEIRKGHCQGIFRHSDAIESHP